ncbi:inositol 2-dehydrogenase [Nocardioides mesophilus]|uniref:Inositol 2-dehydrogenase n=1 Tax=Nocardioides mesophilus TaxID=433659 RepID=A0A7G9RFM5_9ACTN|nr:inositol 2-dehydrogenase [Nocardioides mesophilus]QNN54400.1 inositol 2-dehydrogenase [Nocardioides mesophilus]
MSKGTRLRIGLVGVGRIGRMHAEIVARQVPGAELTMVYDAARDPAREVAARLHVDAAESAAELVASDRVDAVGICSSTNTHLEIIELAAAAGKAVMCEKPLSNSLAEVHRAVELVNASGIPFMTGFNRRFDPGHQAVHEAVEDGSIGNIHLTRISSRDPELPPLDYLKVSGGLFMDMAIHDFDMARYLAGPVVRVYAQGGVLIDPAIGEAGDIDTAVTVLTHANGSVTVIDNSRLATYGYDQRVEAFGSRGMASSDNRRLHYTEVTDSSGTRQQPLMRFFIDRYADAYRREWDAFTEFVAHGGPSPVSVHDGRAPVVIAEAAAESMRRGTPVEVDGALG